MVENRYQCLRHIVMLVGMFLLIFNAKNIDDYEGNYEWLSLLTGYVFLVSLVYINIYILVPLFFFKAYYLKYVLMLMLFLALGTLLMTTVFDNYFEPHRIKEAKYQFSVTRKVISGVFFFAPFILVSTTIKLTQRWIKDKERINELDKVTLNMELTVLKNQINPHFLFNMLNNVNMLVKADPEKASLIILKLSDFLRYQLYDNNEEQTILKAEVDFLSNFLNLEKIRRDDFNFFVDFNLAETKNIWVPPNLFTTFVENAIKHSFDTNDGPTYVHISFAIEGQRLVFSCVNSLSEDEFEVKTEIGGLGLANIRRRLTLLYGDKYQLNMGKNAKKYIVELNIPI